MRRCARTCADTKPPAKLLSETLLLVLLEVEVPPINVMGSEAPPLYMRASAPIASPLVAGVSVEPQGLPSLVPEAPPLTNWQLTILARVPLREHLTSGVRPERTNAKRKRRVSIH